MAGRKPEPGISYYKMNCGHTMNKKVKLLFNEFGSDGYWIWQCIIDQAYSHKGYYFDCNDKEELELFATDVCKKQVSLVEEVIAGCLRRSLFDKRVSEMFGVLSSVMMQEVYLEATSERRRKGTEIELYEDLLLIKIPDNAVNISIVPWNNSILPRKNDNVPGSNATKKSIVEESKEEKSKVNSNGVVPPDAGRKKPDKKRKNEEPPEPHWEKLVEAWFNFNKEKFKVEPSFKDQDPRLLKKIVQELKKRAEKKNLEWSEPIAVERFKLFLEHAYKNPWLKEHFLLENLNKQFDVIIQPKPKLPPSFSLPPKQLSKIEKHINDRYYDLLENRLMPSWINTEDFEFLVSRGIQFNAYQQDIVKAVDAYVKEQKFPNQPGIVEPLAKCFAVIEFFKEQKSNGAETIFRLE